ncbi:MAG: ribonuclease R [Deltaproteobacteria bacterium]|nr:ribonuclease R [Deltaproteobacteria bacterium]
MSKADKTAKIGVDKVTALFKEGAFSKKPLSFKELTRLLEVDKDERHSFKRLLNELVAKGELVKIRGGRFALPSKMNMVDGELTCHADGYGFVIPDDGGEDVFVGARRLRGAMHGDKVIARIEGTKPGGKREGSIVRITERANEKIVGIFRKGKGFSTLIPLNERITTSILIPPGEEKDSIDGLVVEAAVIKWPERHEGLLMRVVAVLGPPDDFAVELEVITKKYGLLYQFPRDVEIEAKAVPGEVLESDIGERVDLRSKPIVTIDGETAKDFDDAVCVERLSGGGYRLYVSIADVSHYVKPGTALDREAYGRATSVYFPGSCIPMLPEKLSNGICSLNPKVDRLTMTAEMEFDKDGRPQKSRFYESVIKSVERMTYTNVKKALEGSDAEVEERYKGLIGDFRLMKELALKLNLLRSENGSLDFDLPEPQIILDIEGRPQDIIKSERNIAHRIIEEFMLAANKAVAEIFSKRGLAFVYRIHEAPDSEKMDEFRKFVATFGYDLKGASPTTLQKLLKHVDGKTEEKLINHLLLRSMKQAVYSEMNIGHFGLAFEDYTHFTSPIRRYPDLMVHRLLKDYLAKRGPRGGKEALESYLAEASAHCSKRERNAMEAEREIVDLKKTQFMKDKVGEEHDGVISGVTGFGIFVELSEYFVEGLVHITALGDDYYEFVEKEHALVGSRTKKRYRLGSPVRVRVVSADVMRRRIDMEIAGQESVGRRGPGAGKNVAGKNNEQKKSNKQNERGSRGKKRRRR